MVDWHSLIGVPQCMDCLDLMRLLPDGCINAVIVDPPFGTGTAVWDKEPDPRAWTEMQRLCPCGPIAVMGYAKQLMRWSRYFDGLQLVGYIVWHKYNEQVVSPGLTRTHQDIAVWGMSQKQVRASLVRESYSSMREDIAKWHNGLQGLYEKDKTEFGKRLRVHIRKSGGTIENYRGSAARHPDGKRCTDLWRIPAPGAGFNSHLRKHKNQKPDELLDKLTRLLTDEGDLVLDCYAGSFSLATAAQRLGRQWICGDNCTEYVDRFKAELAQPQQVELSMSYG